MSESNSNGLKDFNSKTFVTEDDFDDKEIDCIDCEDKFTWSSGEQLFFHDKNLKHPPKRCKPCKKAKNERLEAINKAQSNGYKEKIEVQVNCAKCNIQTTVPFYPSQGRPVYCRSCFLAKHPNTLGQDNS